MTPIVARPPGTFSATSNVAEANSTVPATAVWLIVRMAVRGSTIVAMPVPAVIARPTVRGPAPLGLFRIGTENDSDVLLVGNVSVPATGRKSTSGIAVVFSVVVL